MEPAKQAKIVREFQKQSTQMDMTVGIYFQSGISIIVPINTSDIKNVYVGILFQSWPDIILFQ